MTKCKVCNEEIEFRKNSTDKWIPFNKSDGKCHFESCVLKPKSDDKEKLAKPDGFWKPKGISYKTILANKTLEEFNG